MVFIASLYYKMGSSCDWVWIMQKKIKARSPSFTEITAKGKKFEQMYAKMVSGSLNP
jgi:hypothetical protein